LPFIGKDNLNEWIRPNGDSYKIAKKALKKIMEKAFNQHCSSYAVNERVCAY